MIQKITIKSKTQLDQVKQKEQHISRRLKKQRIQETISKELDIELKNYNKKGTLDV